MKLLVDGDLVCFSTAIAFQKKNPFKEGDILYDGKLALAVLEHRIRKFMSDCGSTDIEFHFSCDRRDNWRRQINSEYKMNREGKLTPIGLPSLITHVMSSYPYIKEGILEADDTIALAATGKYEGNNVVVSIDKDFLTLPTKVYNWNKKKTVKQSRKEAFKFFISQLICGDSADNFKGIHRIGPKGAAKFLDKHDKHLANIWEPLCELAAMKKHSEKYMIIQARMAYLLRDGDYDEETKEIKLWEPEMIQEML